MSLRRRAIAWSLTAVAPLIATALIGWGLIESARGALRSVRTRGGDPLASLPGADCGECGHPWAGHPGGGGADICGGCIAEQQRGASAHCCRRDVRDAAVQARRFVEQSSVLMDALFAGYERADLYGESERIPGPVWEWLIDVDTLVSGLHSTALWESSRQSVRRRVEFVAGVDELVDRRPADLDDPGLLATLGELRAVVVGFSAI